MSLKIYIKQWNEVNVTSKFSKSFENDFPTIKACLSTEQFFLLNEERSALGIYWLWWIVVAHMQKEIQNTCLKKFSKHLYIIHI